MARSTDTKRTAAKSKLSATRSPAGRSTAAAGHRSPRPPRPEEPRHRLRTRAWSPGSGDAPRERPRRACLASQPEHGSLTTVPTTATTVTDGAVEPAAGLGEPPVQSNPSRDHGRGRRRRRAGSGRRGSRQRRARGRCPGAQPARAAVDPGPAAPALAPRRSLVEGTIDMHEQMVAFACRQTECGLAASRAMLASRSLPEIVSLQSAFVGRSVENAVAHTRETDAAVGRDPARRVALRRPS